MLKNLIRQIFRSGKPGPPVSSRVLLPWEKSDEGSKARAFPPTAAVAVGSDSTLGLVASSDEPSPGPSPGRGTYLSQVRSAHAPEVPPSRFASSPTSLAKEGDWAWGRGQRGLTFDNLALSWQENAIQRLPGEGDRASEAGALAQTFDSSGLPWQGNAVPHLPVYCTDFWGGRK